MFTFREKTQQSIHPHRLLYLHSTQKDKNITGNTKRFKTQPFDMQQDLWNNQAYYTINKAGISKSSRYASQRKIKYFDLDLKSLVDNTNADSELISERQSYAKTVEPIKCHSENERQKERISKSSLISKNDRRTCQIKSKNNCKNGQVNNSRPNQVFREIENLLQKQYISEIDNLQTVRDFKKAKIIAQNNKDFKQKYAKIKMNQYQPYPKLISSNYLKSKPKKQKQNQEGLQVKRVERLLVDKMGNQYKVTIQKIL